MSLLLVCDAPGCFATVPAIARQGRPSPPNQWWKQPAHDGSFVVGCCEAHFSAALKGRTPK